MPRRPFWHLKLERQHPDQGYRFIGRQLGDKLRVRLSWSHQAIIRRIIRSIRGQGDVDVDVRDHMDAIKIILNNTLSKATLSFEANWGSSSG